MWTGDSYNIHSYLTTLGTVVGGSSMVVASPVVGLVVA
jgi:hypothetical protein